MYRCTPNSKEQGVRNPLLSCSNKAAFLMNTTEPQVWLCSNVPCIDLGSPSPLRPLTVKHKCIVLRDYRVRGPDMPIAEKKGKQ